MSRRNAIVIAVAVVVVVLLWWGIKGRSKSSAAEEKENANPNVVELKPEAIKNAGITVEPAKEEEIVENIKVTGVVSPDESRVAHILPLSKGVVEDLYVQLGTRVKKGDSLLVYDNVELGEVASEHSSFHAQLNRDRAQLAVATKAVQRAENLIRVEAISTREFELRQAEKQQAEAAVESTQANIARAEEKLHRFGLSEAQVNAIRDTGMNGREHRTASHNLLKAPFDGVITKFDVSRGEAVDQQKELFTIVDTSRVWVLADVYEKDIAAISKSGPCEVKVASYPDEKFAGTIEYLSDALDPQTRTAKLRCVVPNQDGRLKLEMFAEVVVSTKKSATLLTVSSAGIQEINGQKVVFIALGDNVRFEKREVEIGQTADKRTQVLSGLKAGEKVVANGSFHVKSAFLREEIGEGE